MPQSTTPTIAQTVSSNGDTTAVPEWRDFAAAIRESLVLEHPGWATISGVITTHPPYKAALDAPTSMGGRAHQAKPAMPPAAPPTNPAKTAHAAPRTDLDAMLEFVEAEAAQAAAELLADALPPLADGAGKEAPVHTLRPTAALAVSRLAAG